MSWSARTTEVAAAFASRPEPEVWLLVSKNDLVKVWAQWDLARATVGQLLECEYSGDRVVSAADGARKWYKEDARPVWFGMDDPPLLYATIFSLPAPVMKAAGLSKDRTARALAGLVASPAGLGNLRPITKRDWRLAVWLDTETRELVTRVFDRYTRRGEWKQVEERREAVEEGG